jgi:hypothetical protein
VEVWVFFMVVMVMVVVMVRRVRNGFEAGIDGFYFSCIRSKLTPCNIYRNG